MRPTLASVGTLLFALLGFSFASVSTRDFVAHLDRQVHGIHCSFLPGLDAADASGTSGCHVTLMSPYSSVARDTVWGGIPIALPAMSVFAFLAFWTLAMVLGRLQRNRGATRFLVAATLLPVGASLAMGYLSLQVLDAACKLCIGIYVASLGCFVCAVLAHRQARTSDAEELGMGWLAAAFALGVVFVALPVQGYVSSAPDFDRYVGQCGELAQPQDPHGALLPIGSQTGEFAMIEVLDPLCASCKGFEARLSGMPAHAELSRQALLFPLDPACNWMVSDAIHPGACAVSEALLCAADDADRVLAWAFEEQARIMEATRNDPDAASRLVKEKFPELARCVGSAGARARLNQALRWAVKNQLRVLTPQVFVRGLRLCDEDTDLGLDYALPRLMAMAKQRPAVAPQPEPVPGPSLAVSRKTPRSAGRPEAQPEAVPLTPGAGSAPTPTGGPEPAENDVDGTDAPAETTEAAEPADTEALDLPAPPEQAP